MHPLSNSGCTSHQSSCLYRLAGVQVQPKFDIEMREGSDPARRPSFPRTALLRSSWAALCQWHGLTRGSAFSTPARRSGWFCWRSGVSQLTPVRLSQYRIGLGLHCVAPLLLRGVNSSIAGEGVIGFAYLFKRISLNVSIGVDYLSPVTDSCY